MRKFLLLVAAWAVCLALISGCSLTIGGRIDADEPKGGDPTAPSEPEGGDPTVPSEPEEVRSKRDDIPFSDGQLYAIAYLGYQSMESLELYSEKYLDSGELPVHHVSDGDYYLVIPRYDGMSLKLYVNDIETSEERLVYEDPDCRPFIVQCNASDVFADVTVELDHDGQEAVYSPFISLEDGSVQAGEFGLDLTLGLVGAEG